MPGAVVERCGHAFRRTSQLDGYGLWRSLVSALDWGSRGPGFKSRQPDSLTWDNGRSRFRGNRSCQRIVDGDGGDVTRALAKVDQFVQMLEQHYALSRLTRPPPERSLAVAAINEQIGLVDRIAREVDPRIATRLREETMGWPYGETLAAAQELRGRLAGLQEEAEILEPTGPTLAASQLHPWGGWRRRSGTTGTDERQFRPGATAIFDVHLPVKLGVDKGTKPQDLATAFSPEPPGPGKPRLRFRHLTEGTNDWKSAHQGAMYLGYACALAVRNVTSHTTDQPEEQVALEALATLSLFARWADQADVKN